MNKFNRLKPYFDFLIGPCVGALSLTMMVGDGRLLYFFGVWTGLFLLFGTFSYWMLYQSQPLRSGLIRLGDAPPKDSLYSHFFFFFLGFPLINIISKMLQFRSNAFNVIISIIAILGASVPAWKRLYHHLSAEGSGPRIFTAAWMTALVMALLVPSFLLRASGLSQGLPYEYYWDEPYAISPALHMFRDNTLNPHFFGYPSFVLYYHWLGSHISYAILKNASAITSPQDIITGWESG